MHSPLPLTRDLVLIGGGHTHALVLRMWGMKPLHGVRLTVINPGPAAPYSGMLPGFVAGHYERDELDIDLVQLARFAGARVILGHATGIDRQARRITVPGRPDVFYDVASVDIGISSDLPSLPGFNDNAVPAKPLGTFADRWHAHVTGSVRNPDVAIIGAGVAGVELALACRYRMQSAGISGNVTLLEAAPMALKDIGQGARAALLAQLAEQGVTLRTNASVAEVLADGVQLQGGEVIPAGLVIGAAGAKPQDWLVQTGLDLTDGFIDVTPELHSLTDPRIFATGDCAHLTFDPRPKAGVFAVRQAPVLFNNLRAALGVGQPRAFKPQKDYLKLISTGRKHAVADKFGRRFEGAWMWRWKDHIDQKFMRQFKELPDMGRPELPAEMASGLREMIEGHPPLCGGCAAKPGANVLQDGLAGIGGDDAAALGGSRVISTDQFRAFSLDPVLLARVAAIHAMGDIWASGARPETALAQITLPQMRDHMQAETLREMTEALAAELSAIGAELVGGHTSVGPEMAVGLTVTGLHDGHPITLAGAKPGDQLILTKPLGTGVILAAEMQRKAPGAVVANAYDHMLKGAAETSAALTPVAHAVTDVTGYGLAGHLRGILQASGVGATLDLNAIPVLEGSEALISAGVRSSLFDANARALEGHDLADPRIAILADPQTAGGLLAAVPADNVPDFPGARVIGAISNQPGQISLN
ncbi:selenide, water dikinase SelD [Actibacterium pelagium]|uniref:Selenophosphate synthase n=1 Tax=Actibacterium pelagium TaxID=2029103 RepID=A0A917AK64_9RHOB|nr:selenide, water dikinase SelD [Actibacterium pelagium]GGE57655.1 hypothetical protein GCM10011517_26780 [Actibacterium pelagium]